MGVYSRFKKGVEGFRKLVELLETTPVVRRQKMIDVGMMEDPEFTEKALSYMMTFKDVIGLPDAELAEVVAKAPPKVLAIAISQLGDVITHRILRCAKPTIGAQIRDYVTMQVSLAEIGGAQLKIVEVARSLERQGYVRVKKIPA